MELYQLNLKTVGDLMIKAKKLPIVNENIKMKKALKIINNKKLGVLISKKKKKDNWNNN